MRNLDVQAASLGSLLQFRHRSGVVGSVANAVMRAVRRWVAAYRHDWENRSALRALEQLNDRTLDDMGLTRNDLIEARGKSNPHEAIEVLKAQRQTRIARGPRGRLPAAR